MWILLELVVRDKLDDIGSRIHSVSVRVQSLLITIKCVHVAEISITDANDDDA